MLTDSHGNVVLVGQSGELGSNPNMAVARFKAGNLALDNSFGTDGKVTVDFFGLRDGAFAAVQQADGKLVIGGYAKRGTGNVFALARLNP